MAKTMLVKPLQNVLQKTLIIGASGYIGSKLFALYRQQHADLVGTCYQTEHHNLRFFALGQSKLADLAIADKGYQSVIICAGITNIAHINENTKACFYINVQATLTLIKELNALGLHVIFLSSDNVFSGQQGHYSDHSLAEPVSEYGRQKIAVEQQIPKICERYTIVRLAKAVGTTCNDHTILDDISQQLLSNNKVLAAEDLIFNPTAIEDIVKVMPFIQQQELYGTYNFCNSEIWHRYGLTVAMAKRLGISVAKVKKIKFSELDNSAKRPLNTTMNNSPCFAGFPFKSIASCMAETVENQKAD